MAEQDAPVKLRTTTQGGYLTGVQDGWHAVSEGALRFAAVTGDGVRIAQAECGAYVRVAPKFGTYSRGTTPVLFDPCAVCAWTVAVNERTEEAELHAITPDDRTARILTRLGADPFLAPALSRELAVDRRGDWDLDATVRMLAAITRHVPVLAIAEACAEGECGHPSDGSGCSAPDGARAVCLGCSLRSGSEAGEREGWLSGECDIAAPCVPLLAIAAYVRGDETNHG